MSRENIFGRPDAEYQIFPERVRFAQMCRLTSDDQIPTFIVELCDAPLTENDNLSMGDSMVQVQYYAPSANMGEIITLDMSDAGHYRQLLHAVNGLFPHLNHAVESRLPHLHRIDSRKGQYATQWVDDRRLQEIWLKWATHQGEAPLRFAKGRDFEPLPAPEWAKLLRQSEQAIRNDYVRVTEFLIERNAPQNTLDTSTNHN